MTVDIRDLTCLRDSINICNTPTVDVTDDATRLLGQVTIVSFAPIVKATVHNAVLPAPNTDFLALAISPTNPPCTFLIEVTISIAGILYATIIRGGNTQVVSFNSGANLVAGALYIFAVTVHTGDTLNLRYNVTGGTIQIIRIQEADSVVI